MYSTKKRNIILALLPLTLLISLVIFFGVFKTIELSFQVNAEQSIFSNYQKLFNDQEFYNSLIFSFQTALISTLLSIVIGVGVALFLWNSKNKTVIKVLNYLPLITPHIIIAIIFIILLSQTGLISRVSYQLGFINQPSDFIPLINDNKGIGIIIAYVYKEFSFVCIILLIILNSIKVQEIRIAQSLGANSFQLFKKIIFPKIVVSLLFVFMILFIYSFSAFEIPSLLGNSSNKALPVLVYQHYTTIGSKEYALTINLIIIVFCLIMTAMVFVIIKLVQRKYHS